MRYALLCTAAAASLFFSAQALAQPESSPGAVNPPTTPPAANTGTAGPASATTPALTAGLPVKDKTGVTIGQVTDVTADASGKQTVTIKMGADSFKLDAASLALQNGAATVNATQAELRDMIKASRPSG